MAKRLPPVAQFNAGFNWKEPDYAAVIARRIRFLNWIRSDETGERLGNMKAFYGTHPIHFINDWGVIHEPRNPEIGLPARIPFVLFPRQVEFLEWMLDSWHNRRSGVAPKSRESGVTWLSISLCCTLGLFNRGLHFGFGSRKLELVDKLGDSDCIFWKGREFLAALPVEFKDGWTYRDAPERLIKLPTGSTVKGEGGDEIGRGGRCSIYVVDEAAFLEHPKTADAALSNTTRCRIDISTPNGMGNSFAEKCLSKAEAIRDEAGHWEGQVFRFHWRQDPRKDEAWYAAICAELDDPVIIAQEVDIDFSASVEGVIIPSAWIASAIDAHVKLGFAPTGMKAGALDVADQGRDLNAFAGAEGVVLTRLEEWSGYGSDTFATAQRTFEICDDEGYDEFFYDADGIGASIRGDGRIINDQRAGKRRKLIRVRPFRGSSKVINPRGQDIRGRFNEDFFKNGKAQGWWRLRRRFQLTHRAIQRLAGVIEESSPIAPHEDLISIDSTRIDKRLLTKLMGELSQPTYQQDNSGKLVVDKVPDGARSPNLADAVMMRYSGATRMSLRLAPDAKGRSVDETQASRVRRGLRMRRR
jgi:phage terminase large subunit